MSHLQDPQQVKSSAWEGVSWIPLWEQGGSDTAQGKDQFKRKALALWREGLFAAEEQENPWISRRNGLLASRYLLGTCWTTSWWRVPRTTNNEEVTFWCRLCKAGPGNGLFQQFPKLVTHHNHQECLKQWGPTPGVLGWSMWGKLTAPVIYKCSPGGFDQPWTPHGHLAIICPILREMKAGRTQEGVL